MTSPREESLLNLLFEGESILEGRILWNDLAQFVSSLDSAIQRIINVLETGTGVRIGRPTKAFQALTALEVTVVGSGSFMLGLNLRRGQDFLPGFDLGVQAISRLVQGLRTIEHDPLPVGFDLGVLMALREAGHIFDRGIETVHLDSGTEIPQPRATFARNTHQHIVSRLQTLEQAWAEAEGRLLMADVREDSLRCRLHPSAGQPLLCSFPEDMAADIMRNLRHFVRIRGEATTEPATGRIRSFTIRDLESIEEPAETTEVTVTLSSSFWQARSFDDLALEQGVYPIENWESITGGWPEDADFETFLEAIRSSRSE